MANQMFTIATTAAHAWRNGDIFSVPLKSGKRNQFDMMFPSLPKTEGCITGDYYREKQFGIYNPIPVSSNQNQLLHGYFQSEKYFSDYRKEVIELFDIPKMSLVNGLVGVHVRRGDYIPLSWKHNLLPKEWIEEAMSKFPGHTFEFHSDDIEWCKEKFGHRNDCFFSHEEDPKKAISSLAYACEHGIMSASSFSWWSNWISPNNEDGRRVIAPKNWFNSDYKRLRSDDIVPENWERL